jgi:hypothetical protein
MYSKSLFRKYSLLFIVLVISFGAFACEISLKVSDNNKKVAYSPGETVIVECTVSLQHRNCTSELSDIKFTSDGCKITGATKWVQASPGVYTRKLKVQVSSPKNSNVQIICQRSCDKEGGYCKLILPE